MSAILFKNVMRAKTLIEILLWAFVWASFETSFALAQEATVITPTTGVGNLGTAVMADGNTIKITGGTRPSNGTSLFHSFAQFNVGQGDAAQFLNTTPTLNTANILSRVTGGSPSSIFGTIDTSSYPGANLFLMNPAGIVFGPSATLNVQGSVAFSTADYLRLAGANGSNAGIFHANPTATSLLNSASIAAFGFLSPNPEAIEIQGSKLTVQPGQSLALVGGNITVQSGMLGNSADPPPSAPGKQILIVSVASPGEVLAENFGQAPNIQGQSFGALGTVQISQNSKIDASGESGGRILVKGDRLLVDDSTISANSTKAAKSGVGRRLDPSWLGIGIEIEMAQGATIDNGSVIETNVVSGAHTGSAGVRITTETSGTVQISKRSHIEASGEGGGTILVRGGHLTIDNSTIVTNTADVSLDATSIRIANAARIATETGTKENAGHITVKASGDIHLDTKASVESLAAFALGNAGNITFRSSQGTINFTNEASVTSQTFDSGGNSGSIEIDAPHNEILLTNSRIFTFSGTGTGTPGDLHGGIQISATDLRLSEGSRIDIDNFSSLRPSNLAILLSGRFNLAGRSAIETTTTGPASAADMFIEARDIGIADGSTLVSQTVSSGAGGAVKVTATNQVSLINGASVTASSIDGASGNAGNISVNAGQQLEVLDGSSITTRAAKASGGNIDIRAIDRIRFVNSTVSTSVLAEDGKGGNIFIDPNVVILEGSEITAKAVGGAGGNITFVTPLFLADSASLSRLSAKSESGLNGTVTIQSPTSNLSGTVGQLASKTNPPQVLLQNRCVALAGGEQSTFILAGRDALPSEPGGWLSSPVAMEHWTGEETEEQVSGVMVRSRGWNTQPVLVMSKDETTVLSLRRLTPPGFLVRSFAVSAATGCSS